MTTTPVTFFHAPHSRSGVTRALFEELGVPFDMVAIDLPRDEQRTPEYLAINPMGKVPAIRHQGVLVTEQVAILLYLADLYPDRHLAPALDDPLRGAYLRWMVFYGACFEPALTDRSQERVPLPRVSCAYGTFDDVIQVLAAQLQHGPWLLGERFTAADVLWGLAFNFGYRFKLLPESAVFRAYMERVLARPAIQRARAADDALAAGQERQAQALAATA